MDRVPLAPDLSVSRLVYGCWRLTEDDTSASHVQAKLEACLEAGVTTIDQADIYGGYTAEAVLGDALRAAPHLRDRIEIVTKCGIVAPTGRHAGIRVKHYDTSPEHIRTAVERSLAALGVERIDLLLLHRPDPFMDAEATAAALDALVKAGKVAHLGVSNFRPWDWDLLASALAVPLVTNQIEISLMQHAAFDTGDLAFLQRRKVPPMAWSPLGGGALFSDRHPRLRDRLEELARHAGVAPAAIAVAWLLAHPAQIVPVLGTNTPRRIGEMAAATGVKLSRQDWFGLYTLARGAEVP